LHLSRRYVDIELALESRDLLQCGFHEHFSFSERVGEVIGDGDGKVYDIRHFGRVFSGIPSA
jgi:hypothetical protein